MCPLVHYQQGERGRSGERGLQGKTGSSGPAGEPGPSGLNGAVGPPVSFFFLFHHICNLMYCPAVLF